MMARKKPLRVVDPIGSKNTTVSQYFETPPAKGPVKLVDSDNIDGLIDLLHNEAKVI